MNRQYQYKVSLKNYNQLLRNLQNMSVDYFFLPHPVYTACLMKGCAKLFLSELRQISINYNNFLKVDERMAKIMRYINIFHLTSLMSSHYLVRHKSTKFLHNV